MLYLLLFIMACQQATIFWEALGRVCQTLRLRRCTVMLVLYAAAAHLLFRAQMLKL
jgi:hypothetical protein